MTEVGKMIRHLRLKAGLKQKELAEKIGTRPQRISNYERGARYPTARDSYELSRFFERSPADFLKRKKDGDVPPVPVDDRNVSARMRMLNALTLEVRAWPVPVFGESNWFCPTGTAHFGEPFLSLHGINPARCAMVELGDAAMAPALPEGSVVFIDRDAVEPVERETYALMHDGEMSIRRASHGQDGWLFTADGGGRYGVIRWGDETAVVFGRVILSVRLVGTSLKTA